MSGGAPTIQIPRWIQLVGLPDSGADRAPDRREGLSRGLPVPRRGADRAPARPAGALPGTAPDPARLLHRDRLPQLRGRAGRCRDRRECDRHRPDAVGCQSDRQSTLRAESGRPPQTGFERDVDRLQVWLDTHHLERVDVKKQGPDFAQSIKGKDVEKYTTDVIDFLRGRSDLDLPADLRARADPRRLDLHAARHEPAERAALDRRFPPRAGPARADRPAWSGPSPATCAGRCCSR